MLILKRPLVSGTASEVRDLHSTNAYIKTKTERQDKSIPVYLHSTNAYIKTLKSIMPCHSFIVIYIPLMLILKPDNNYDSNAIKINLHSTNVY